MSFQNKVALITGSGSGIGEETALAFAREGAKVIVSDIDMSSGNAVVDKIKLEGGEAHFIHCDVSQYDHVKQLVSATVAKYGQLDIAINNAGIGGMQSKTMDYANDTWDQVMAVNATGVFYCMKEELQQMTKQGSGVVVNTASIAGLKGLPHASAYVASKHAVIGLTKTAALEYAKKNIRINALCPVFTVTGLFNPEVMDQISDGLSDRYKHSIPMKRFADVSEMAQTTLFLCSDQASFITGQSIAVDGGLTA